MGRYVSSQETEHITSHQYVIDWLGAYSSTNTKKSYRCNFSHFLLESELDVDTFYSLDHDPARDALTQVIRKFRDDGRMSKARETYHTVKSFRAYHGIPIALRRQDIPKRYRKKLAMGMEHVPSEEEVFAMIKSSKKEDEKALIAVLYVTGCRVNALRSLTLGMVRSYLYPEIQAPIPLRITQLIDKKLRSSEITYYYTFIHQIAAEYLRNWTDKLQAKPDNYPIFNRSNSSVLSIVKRLASNIRIPRDHIWTHLLRKSFRKVLNRSTLDEDTKEALMGHKLPGSRGNYFDWSDMEEIRSKYSKLEFRTESKVVNDIKDQNRKLIEKTRSMSDQIEQMNARIEKLDRLEANAININDIINDFKPIPYTDPNPIISATPSSQSITVQADDFEKIEQLFNQGYNKVHEYNDKIIMKQ